MRTQAADVIAQRRSSLTATGGVKGSSTRSPSHTSAVPPRPSRRSSRYAPQQTPGAASAPPMAARCLATSSHVSGRACRSVSSAATTIARTSAATSGSRAVSSNSQRSRSAGSRSSPSSTSASTRADSAASRSPSRIAASSVHRSRFRDQGPQQATRFTPVALDGTHRPARHLADLENREADEIAQLDEARQLRREARQAVQRLVHREQPIVVGRLAHHVRRQGDEDLAAAALLRAPLAHAVEDDAPHHLADVGEEGWPLLRQYGAALRELQEALVDDRGGVEIAAIAACAKARTG